MRVFVLGAGASIHAGYPLAATMGNSLAAWIKGLPSGDKHRVCFEQVVGVYGSFHNFESVLADLMTNPPSSLASSLGATRPCLLTELKEAIRGYFDLIRSRPARLYDGLARLLQEGDVVITFNYDLGVERARREARLWEIKSGYAFSLEGPPSNRPWRY